MGKPYKRSIWDKNREYETENKLDDKLIQKIGVIQKIQRVEAAKKQAPPIPLKDLAKIAESSDKFSNIKTDDEFREKIEKLGKIYGCGVKTGIAIIAVISKGKYPPIDKKNLAGLCKKGVITKKEEKILNGKSYAKIASIYFDKILPEWKKDLPKNNNDPKLVDEKWAR